MTSQWVKCRVRSMDDNPRFDNDNHNDSNNYFDGQSLSRIYYIVALFCRALRPCNSDLRDCDTMLTCRLTNAFKHGNGMESNGMEWHCTARSGRDAIATLNRRVRERHKGKAA